MTTTITPFDYQGHAVRTLTGPDGEPRKGVHPTDIPVRATDPITSQWAADSIADATTSQAVVLRAVREYPKGHEFTLANVALLTGRLLSPSRARTAVRELQDKGLIEETGRYATMPSGRKARLLTLTETGRAAA